MERLNGPKAKSGRRLIITRKRASLHQGPISNTEPHTVEQDPLTFLANYVDSGSLGRSNTHLKKHSSSLICGLPSDGDVRPDVDYEGVLKLPFLEPGSLKDQNKPKKLKRKLDSAGITQPLHTKTALETASGSRRAVLRSLDGVSSNGVLQNQNSGADHGGKRPCREEEEHSKGLSASPLNSEHVTSSSSSDSSLQLVPVDVLSTGIQNGPTSPSSPQSQPTCRAPEPAILSTDPPNHHPRDDSSSTLSASATSSKILISPNGSGFYPNHIEVVHCISRIIQSKFEGPWPTWSKVPRNVRDYWFDELQKHYYWEPQHARQIRLNFDSRGAGRLTDMFCAARKEIDVRPFWLSLEVWDALKQYWASPQFQNISNKARINRGSNCDGLGPSLHTCGSIPMSEHKRRLEEETGEEVTPIKLFVHTHQRKDKTWVDARSSHAYEKFLKKWNALQSGKENPSDPDTQADEQTSTQPAAQLSEAEVWAKTNTTKKGAIYGLGSEAVHYKQLSNPSTSRSNNNNQPTPAWFDSPEFQELLSKKVMEISSEWHARLEEEQRKTEELERRVAELEKEKQAKKSKKKAKKKLTQMKEMMKMLQKSYESLSKAGPSRSDSDDDDDDDSTDSD